MHMEEGGSTEASTPRGKFRVSFKRLHPCASAGAGLTLILALNVEARSIWREDLVRATCKADEVSAGKFYKTSPHPA